jgi:hypothetical protein
MSLSFPRSGHILRRAGVGWAVQPASRQSCRLVRKPTGESAFRQECPPHDRSDELARCVPQAWGGRDERTDGRTGKTRTGRTGHTERFGRAGRARQTGRFSNYGKRSVCPRLPTGNVPSVPGFPGFPPASPAARQADRDRPPRARRPKGSIGGRRARHGIGFASGSGARSISLRRSAAVEAQKVIGLR